MQEKWNIRVMTVHITISDLITAPNLQKIRKVAIWNTEVLKSVEIFRNVIPPKKKKLEINLLLSLKCNKYNDNDNILHLLKQHFIVSWVNDWDIMICFNGIFQAISKWKINSQVYIQREHTIQSYSCTGRTNKLSKLYEIIPLEQRTKLILNRKCWKWYGNYKRS